MPLGYSQYDMWFHSITTVYLSSCTLWVILYTNYYRTNGLTGGSLSDVAPFMCGGLCLTLN